jgi:uncharacterized protein (TIGR02246 family)
MVARMPGTDAVQTEDDATFERKIVMDIAATIATVLDGWSEAIARHDPDGVASFFTEDALFQGLRPDHSIGRRGVSEYYAAQPMGLTADYRLIESRELADDVLLGYLGVDFGFVDRPTLPVHLTVVLRLVDGAWLISHYHVSRID